MVSRPESPLRAAKPVQSPSRIWRASMQMVSAQVGPHVRQVMVLRASKREVAGRLVSCTHSPGWVRLPVAVLMLSFW